MVLGMTLNSSLQSCNESTFSRVRVLHVESSPSLTGQKSSPSPAGFESESRCLWLEFKSESKVAETTQLKTGVPQGLVLGPILFTSFISLIEFVTSQFNVDQQQYADDTQVFISLSKSNSPGPGSITMVLP